LQGPHRSGAGDIASFRCRSGPVNAPYIRQANLKDVQAHLRHSSAETTLQIYVQEIPESVRLAVEQMADRMFPRNVKLTAETDGKLH